eukprot:m51a1_g9121 hypothetical protein (83) ;mRNA; f:141606-141854
MEAQKKYRPAAADHDREVLGTGGVSGMQWSDYTRAVSPARVGVACGRPLPAEAKRIDIVEMVYSMEEQPADPTVHEWRSVCD